VVQEQAEELADAAQFTVELDGGLVRLNGVGLTRLGVLGLGERCPTCGHPRLPQLEELEGLRILRQRVGEAGSEARVIIESEDLDEVLDLRSEIEEKMEGSDLEVTLERLADEIAQRVAEAVSEALAEGGLDSE
jgi:hypothetical protein